MTVTSWPAARAASRTRNGKRPFPAMSPSRMRLSCRRIAPWPTRRSARPTVPGGAAPRPPEDHAPLGGADEVDEVQDLRARQRPVLLDLLDRPRRVQLRLEQI